MHLHVGQQTHLIIIEEEVALDGGDVQAPEAPGLFRENVVVLQTHQLFVQQRHGLILDGPLDFTDDHVFRVFDHDRDQ